MRLLQCGGDRDHPATRGYEATLADLDDGRGVMRLIGIQRRHRWQRSVRRHGPVLAARGEIGVGRRRSVAGAGEAAEEVRRRDSAAAHQRQRYGGGEPDDEAAWPHPDSQSMASTCHRPSVASRDSTSVPASVGTEAWTKLAARSVNDGVPVTRSASTVCGFAFASSASRRSGDNARREARHAADVAPPVCPHAVANVVATACGVAVPGLVLGGRGAGTLGAPSSGTALADDTRPLSAPFWTSDPVGRLPTRAITI